MISSKQLNQVLEYSFAAGSGVFLSPTASFIATPSAYTDSSIPGSVTLSGTIIPNNATDISWNIRSNQSTLDLSIGTDNNILHNLASIPTTIDNHVYSLNVSYKNDMGINLSFTVTTAITISSAGKVGHLGGPVDNFTTASQFDTLAVESGFNSKTQTEMINLFTINVATTSRVVIVIPDSFGTVDIQDNTDSSVLTQFDLVTDASNNRKLFKSTNTLSPGTYHYKLVL